MSGKSDRGAELLQKRLPAALPDFLPAQRWFGGKAQVICSVSVTDIIPAASGDLTAYVAMARVSYSSGQDHHYALALLPSPWRLEGGEQSSHTPGFALEGETGEPRYLICDALHDRAVARLLIEIIRRGSTLSGTHGEMIASPGRALASLWKTGQDVPEPSVMKGEQSNTSVRYGEQFILKFYRRIEEGVNLDLEMGSFLTEKAEFKYTAPLAGSIEYRRAGRPSATLAILQGYVHNQGDAWQYTLEAVGRFLHAAANRPAGDALGAHLELSQLPDSPPLIPSWAEPSLRAYLESIQLLGKRTAELHLALISKPNEPDFAPESFSPAYRQSLSESMIHTGEENLQLLRERRDALPSSSAGRAQKVLERREPILSQFRKLKDTETAAMRTRLHGDYHLGQVLVAGSDFAIIDFEGEPERPLAERRIKRSPLHDVAGMLRSFHYAAKAALRRQQGEASGKLGEQEDLEFWSTVWRHWASAAFLQAYCREAAGACFLPEPRDDVSNLLRVFMLEKALYELGYELKNRPDWAEIPLDGILDLV